ncbi:MAG: YggS family pyridoxal phosphate-dependent enzyme [Longimicrobiales bacterium]
MYEARLRTNLPQVEARIERARSRAGSGPVTIVAVTKGHPPAAAAAAAALGMSACGENRVQELEDKRAALGAIDIAWHLIGHLQRNKVRRALPLFDLIHSVDSLRLARELSAEAERAGRTVDALVQVNASGEETKGGFDASHGSAPIGEVCALPHVQVRGLMTMAPFTADEPLVRATFARTRALFHACARDVAEFRAEHLSMGMSNDFEMAVEEGATLVRLGTILFGERER